MNNFNAIGRVCNDLEIKKSKNDKEYLKFDLAIPSNYKNKDGEKETDFVSCIAFNNLATLISNYVEKGDRIGIIGQLKSNNYETAEGSKVRGISIVLEKIDFISIKKNIEGSLVNDESEDIDDELIENILDDDEIL